MRRLEGGEGKLEKPCGFARQKAAADGLEYTVDEAEKQDLRYLIENSCISCNKVMQTYMIKVVPSRYIQEKDAYVRAGIVARRVMCLRCYNSMQSRTRLALHYSAMHSRIFETAPAVQRTD
jgi:hypothetical protein